MLSVKVIQLISYTPLSISDWSSIPVLILISPLSLKSFLKRFRALRSGGFRSTKLSTRAELE